MEKPQQMVRAAFRRLDLPYDILSGEPVLELKGGSELTVIHHRGIRRLTEQSVVVGSGLGAIEICGSGLRVGHMNRERVVILGRIVSIQIGETVV